MTTPNDIPYPALVETLRKEFEDKAPFTEETYIAMEARLKELQPHRALSVLTMRHEEIVGVCEGRPDDTSTEAATLS